MYDENLMSSIHEKRRRIVKLFQWKESNSQVCTCCGDISIIKYCTNRYYLLLILILKNSIKKIISSSCWHIVYLNHLHLLDHARQAEPLLKRTPAVSLSITVF